MRSRVRKTAGPAGSTVMCGSCRSVPVIRTSGLGSLPHCDACKEARRDGRNKRLRDRVRSGTALGHCNKNGDRYSDHATAVDVICRFCKKEFKRSTRITDRATCTDCVEKIKFEKNAKTLKTVKEIYWRDPKAARRKRLKRILETAGLSIEWYDENSGKCAICKTTDPGKKGWAIDHDHGCCPPGLRQGCAKCIRGILCSNCNTALGLLKEDPTRLISMLRYLKIYE